MSDFDDDLPEAPPAEGVRILGAEEAQAAVEGGPDRAQARRSRRVGAAAPRRPTTCSPRPASRSRPTASRATIPDHRRPAPHRRPAVGDPSGPMPLPHWTEPPTGEVPMIADEPGDEEVWAAAAQPAALPLRRRRLERRVRLRAGRRRPPRRDHRDGRAGRRARGRRRRGVRGRRSQLDASAPARRNRTKPSRRAAHAVPRQPPRRVAVPDHRRRDRRAARDRHAARHAVARRPHHAHHHRRGARRGRDPRVRHRSRRHRGARHRDRRRRRVRALRGLPPGRLPARHPARAAGLPVDGGHRLQPRGTGVPAGHRGGRRLHAVLVPGQGRARPADGQRRGHHLRLLLRRPPRRLRGPAARVPRRRRHGHRPRAVRGELRRRRLLRRHAHGAPPADARRVAQQDARRPRRRHGRVGA